MGTTPFSDHHCLRLERFKDENDWSAVCGATACDESQIGQVEWKFGFDKIVWESSAELLVKI